MQLSQVKAIVTGAASGLGKHFVTRLLDEGASVVAGDVHEGRLKTLQNACEVGADRLWPVAVDVSQESRVQPFVREAFRCLPGCNVLINNAGILRDGLLVVKEGEFVRTLPLLQWQ